MIKVVVKSVKIAGWVVEFSGDEVEKVKAHCDEKHESIECFFSGPSEEETVREVLGDEYWDMYDAADTSGLGLGGYFPVFDTNVLEIEVYDDETLLFDDWNKITINKEVKSSDCWQNEAGDKKAIAYSFGYISEDTYESVFEFDDVEDFELSKLKMAVVKNDFLGWQYIDGFTYDTGENSKTYGYFDDQEDFDGDYFSPGFFTTLGFS